MILPVFYLIHLLDLCIEDIYYYSFFFSFYAAQHSISRIYCISILLAVSEKVQIPPLTDFPC